ncbi:MAG TPA: hypothetical protein VMT20_00980 [Terriglobia bacterium]|nr:hypothetical protein [Terriglobia bacterium]
MLHSNSLNSGCLSARHYAGLLLLSLATLQLELALTRVLSVSLWYHFGFLVISTALLGFGASGVTLALWTGLRERRSLDAAIGTCALAFALSVVLSFWLMQRIPFDPFSVAVDRRQFLFMPIYFLLVALPFFCSGLAISLLLVRGASQINRLYCYDLLGAGLGCALVALVIPRFGGSGSVLFAAFVGAAAAVCFSSRAQRALVTLSALSAVLLLAASFRGERTIPIHISANKHPHAIRAIYSAWNTLSLVEVVDSPPQGKEPGSRTMFIDSGTAATGISDLRPDVRTVLAEHPEQVSPESSIAYLGKPNPSILIIGSGGGYEVLEGLKAHASSITAVEINSTITDVVANRMNGYWGNLFHQPEVRLVNDEGRSFIRRSSAKYDAIISVHTISNAAVSSGALSLAESYILTREAFEDYLDHLKPDGAVFFTRPEFQIARLFATAREAFSRRGLGPLNGHVMAYLENAGFLTVPGHLGFVAGFLLQRSEIRPEQLNEIRKSFQAAAAADPDAAVKILYAPDEPHPGSIYDQIVSAPDLEQVYRGTDAQLAPATDDKPFFNQHTRWSRIRWNTIVDLFSQQQPAGARLSLEDRPIAEVTLLILLLQSAAIAALCILAPLALLERQSLRVIARWKWLAYFAALGLGFIMIEIALLQRFLLFLGEPIYTYAVVLAGLLIFTGLGSYAAGKWGAGPEQTLRWVLPLLLLLVAATAVITPPVFHLFLGSSLAARIAIAVLLIAPLGFVLGMPFPLGLRIAMQQSSALGSWAWGVNGFFTVIGTVLALMLGMMIGFRLVLFLACGSYLAAWAAIARLAALGLRVQSSVAIPQTAKQV